jgi:hypothetical protein
MPPPDPVTTATLPLTNSPIVMLLCLLDGEIRTRFTIEKKPMGLNFELRKQELISV